MKKGMIGHKNNNVTASINPYKHRRDRHFAQSMDAPAVCVEADALKNP